MDSCHHLSASLSACCKIERSFSGSKKNQKHIDPQKKDGFNGFQWLNWGCSRHTWPIPWEASSSLLPGRPNASTTWWSCKRDKLAKPSPSSEEMSSVVQFYFEPLRLGGKTWWQVLTNLTHPHQRFHRFTMITLIKLKLDLVHWRSLHTTDTTEFLLPMKRVEAPWLLKRFTPGAVPKVGFRPPCSEFEAWQIAVVES